jgi:dTDP-4-dehydrorhamnose reductase
MNVMILGATGMLGNTLFRLLGADPSLTVYGTTRSEASKQFFASENARHIVPGIDVESVDSLLRAYSVCTPDVVVNCIGLVKQLADANNPLLALPVNSLLPHRLALMCEATGSRLIHVSTDCVFSGAKGNYLETDFPDANDLYGRSKLLGEVDGPHAITLRTSIIGHELVGNKSLLNWFLSQDGVVKGFTRAIFSGLPTVELSRVIKDFVIPNPQLRGLYHVSATPINKYDLLCLIASVYGRNNAIQVSEELVIDRSLDSTRFRSATGYVPEDWETLVQKMFAFK